MSARTLAQIAEAVSETEEPAMIYLTTISGGLDRPIGYVTSPDPVAALEEFAKWSGINDYSVDTDDLRIVLCPYMSVIRYYVYRTTREDERSRCHV